MPATVRAVGTSNSGANTIVTFAATMPVGFLAGDLLIGIAGNGGGDVPTTRPSGSTTVQNIDDGTVFNLDIVRKVAVGGDTFSWAAPVARKWAACVIAITTGTYNTTTPVQGNVGLAKGTTSNTAWVTPSSTPGNADSLIISAFGAQVACTWTTADATPSMTEICDTTSTGTVCASLGVYRSNTAPAVSAVTRAATSSLASANGCQFQLFVNPAAGGAVTLPSLVMAPMRR